MYLINLTLENPPLAQLSQAYADSVRDLLWAHLDPAWGIDHIRVKASKNTLELSLFLHGDDWGSSSRQDIIVDNVTRLLARLTGLRRNSPGSSP